MTEKQEESVNDAEIGRDEVDYVHVDPVVEGSVGDESVNEEPTRETDIELTNVEEGKKDISSNNVSTTVIPPQVASKDTTIANTSENAPKSLEESAGWISSFTTSYLNPIFVKGAKLEFSDLGPTSSQDRCERLYTRFEKAWNEENAKYSESVKAGRAMRFAKERAETDRASGRKPLSHHNDGDKITDKRSLWRVLWTTVGYTEFWISMIYYALFTAISFGPPLILDALVSHFSNEEELTDAVLWILVALLFVLPMIGSICVARSNVVLAHAGVQFRNALVNAIYRKSLRLSPAARQSASTGRIVNMFSTDTALLQRFVFVLNNLLLALPTIAIALALIYQQVGVSTFVGLGLILIMIPFNMFLFGWLASERKTKSFITDRRVKMMNEILSGIRIIKSYAWEMAFADSVNKIREEELIILRRIAYIIALGLTIVMQAIPIFLPVITFSVYVALGNELTSAKAFTTISLFNLLQSPFMFLPMGLSQYNQSVVAIRRMMNFFDADELVLYVERDGQPPKLEDSVDVKSGTVDSAVKVSDEDAVIVMENASLGWVPTEGGTALNEFGRSTEMKTSTPSGNAPHGDNSEHLNRSIHTLRDINIRIKRGELIAVVGTVGSGKSSFLSALLGEMDCQNGRVYVNGTIAYCDQRSWIVNETVRDNITFGSAYDESRFDIAMHAANLEEDVKILSGGIQTQIGERGINLSGGQKARVALARAVYRDADIYLLDDPLSAVDAHVGQFLFHECICNVLAGKTRILVTHHMHVLPYCDRIILLHQGEVLAFGTYEEIMNSDLDVSHYFPSTHTMGEDNKENNEKDSPGSNSDLVVDNKTLVETQIMKEREKSNELALARKTDQRATTIISKEERNMGDVSWDDYLYFINSGGLFLFYVMLLSVVIGQGCTVGGSYWLQYWGTESADHSNDDPLSNKENLYFLQIFAVFSAGSLLFTIIRSLVIANHRIQASRKMHFAILSKTLHSPVAFFDTTPIGRILNRFSSDMQIIDVEINQSISQVFNSVAQVLGSIAAISAATKGIFLALMVPMGILYARIQLFFRGGNTSIARLESISRSPIYADFSQALSGVNSIRAYSEQSRFIRKLESTVDRNSVASVTQQLSAQWLAIRLDFIGSFISCFIAVIAAATGSEFIPAGFLAVGLTYSFQLTTYLKTLVRFSAGFEAQMNSVERVRHYIDNLPEEGSGKEVPIETLPVGWPTKGEIVTENLGMRYRDGPLVLENVNLKIQDAEHVGVAGRTGSGKSSLMSAIFRLQESAEGKILIDNVDISTVPLRTLRSKLGIIPQDPILFSATVRFNLDPFDESTDAKIWEVLEAVNMRDHVLSLPNGLEEEVAEGGDNFSAGQRQLICIARALLRNPRIMVLDEATASIDNATDSLIQNMIRDKFRNCTVLTIAHRLHTIIDSDKILVLDSGHVAEFDTPAELLGRQDSLFNSLWQKHLQSQSGHV